jgi:hypothetical protein
MLLFKNGSEIITELYLATFVQSALFYLPVFSVLLRQDRFAELFNGLISPVDGL